MAKATNIIDQYAEGSARERAELIYSNFCSFNGIINACRSRLIYEIKTEEEFSRNHKYDELGVRIQRLGHYSNPTEQEAIGFLDISKKVDEFELIINSDLIPSDIQKRLERLHHILQMMREEYATFDEHLGMLSPEEKRVIIPLLRHRKDYVQMSEETGLSMESLRKRVSRIRRKVIEDVASCFVERI